jgi:cytochrome c oxidase subunit I+III
VSSETGFDPGLYDRLPTSEPRPEGELESLKRVWCGPRGWEYLTVVNNNYVGLYYLGAAFLFFVLAGVLALLMRTQLALPMNGLLSQEVYNQVFTVHGTTMMFLFAVPAVEAFGVLLLPQMLAARDLPFPRLSAYAFWAYLIGGLCFFASIFVGLAPNGGWFMYPPLTGKAFSPGINADFWLLGIGFIEISAIAGAVEIVVGVLKTRAPGMTLDKLPVFAWAMLAFAVMVIVGFPSIILATLLLELERALNWPFFDPTRGGDPLLWQHLFWFFGHPEVYIIFLPGAGMLSMIFPAAAQAPLVGQRLVILAVIATAFMSFGVWVHHMYTTGLPTMSVSFFSAASMAVSLPAGLQVFAWIATAASGRYRFEAPGLFALGALVIFTMGGLTGVMLAMVPFDWQAHDTYFVVAHLHYVLIGGMVFPLFAAFYYWTPMVSRRRLSERVARWVFGLMFAGVHLAFLPMHLTGLLGMPRRVWTYQPGLGWELPNLISTIGAYAVGAGVLLFLLDLARNFRFSAEDNAGNVFGGGTLEWLPTGLYSTRSIPRVSSAYPLWDDPGLAEAVEQGRYFLPRSATGFRETIITSPIRAEPQYLQHIPGPSAWHVAAAVFTAGFFLLLTVQAYGAAVACGVLAIACTLRWLWETDRDLPAAEVDIGGGIRIPTYVAGPTSHGWWAMIVVLTVAGMVFLLLVFSYVFLWSRRPELWAGSPGAVQVLPLGAAHVAAGVLALLAGWWLKHGRPGGAAVAALALAGSAGLVAAAWGADLQAWRALGVRPEESSHGALVFAFLAWQACFVGVVALAAAFIAVRAMRGHFTPRRRASVEVVGLLCLYTAVQGLATLLLTRLAHWAV